MKPSNKFPTLNSANNRLLNAAKNTGILREASPAVQARTANGALSNQTTFVAALDFFAQNHRSNSDTLELWKALRSELGYRGRGLARRILFQLRDVRGGKGERNAFRKIIRHEAGNDPLFLARYLSLIPEYGRWDDLLSLLDTPMHKDVTALIAGQLSADLDVAASRQDGKLRSISLLAKWLPSESAGKRSKELADKVMMGLNLDPKIYRLILSTLRRYLDIVERKMSTGEWSTIQYEKVTSRALYCYRKAFSRHDANRFGQFITLAKQGKVKMNAGTLDPHEIVHQYENRMRRLGWDDSLDAMWANLPKAAAKVSIMPMIDVSASMDVPAGRDSAVTCKTVALALGIYLAQNNTSKLAGQWFSFSDNANVHKFDPKLSLGRILAGINRSDWSGSTNFQKMFDHLLNWYDKGQIGAEDIPGAIAVFSDMQFNAANSNRRTNFEEIRAKFAHRGLTAPTLIFWNLNSRSVEYPATANDTGAILMAGFNTSMLRAMMSGDLSTAREATPLDAMMDVLMSRRYDAVDQDAS